MSDKNQPNDLSWLEELSSGLPGYSYYEKLKDTSSDQYISCRHGILGETVMRKHRIYLDQKYWNYCRDALRGRPQHQSHTVILSLLRDLVNSGKVICPASHVILDETLKQSDPESRSLTALLIDELSAGICLQPYFFFVGFEIYHWLKTTKPDPPVVHPVIRYAWTYPANVLGVSVPHVPALPAEINNAQQKAWFDLSARMSFSRIVKSFSGCTAAGRVTPIEHYLKQDKMCELHRSDFTTFDQAFLLELRGGLETAEAAIKEAFILHYERETGKHVANTDAKDVREATMAVCGLIYSAFQHKKITTQIPSLRIPVGIHAALRYKRMKHRMGDIEDHMHASIALPYCNAYFTDRALGNLITREPLQYDRLYQCTVLWQDADIIRHLERIAKGSSMIDLLHP